MTKRLLAAALALALLPAPGCFSKFRGRVDVPVERSEAEEALIAKAVEDATPAEARELLKLVLSTSTYQCSFDAWLVGISDGKIDCPADTGEKPGKMKAGSQGLDEYAAQPLVVLAGTIGVALQAALNLVGKKLLPLPFEMGGGTDDDSGGDAGEEEK